MKYLLLLSILLLYSCSAQETESKTKVLVFKENNDFDINDIASYKFIPLETSDSCFISSIKQVKMINNKIYINDNGDKDFSTDSKVFIFRWNGEHVKTVQLDRPIRKFTIDKSENYIIAISGNNTGGQDILRYIL